LSNPNNNDGTVAVLIYSNGYHQKLDDNALRELLLENIVALQKDDVFLQVYIRPYKGEESVILYKSSSNIDKDDDDDEDRAEDEDEIKVMKSHFGQKSKVKSQKINEQSIIQGEEVKRHYIKTKKERITNLDIEYIVDDNEDVWLSFIPNLSAIQAKEKSKKQTIMNENSENLNDNSDKKILEELKESPRTLLPSIANNESLNINGDTNLRPSSNQDKKSNISRASSANLGDILSKEGNVYVSVLGPDELPGLNAWLLQSMSAGEELNWTVDLREYNVRTKSPNPAMEQVRKKRGASRHNVSYSLVALIRHADKLLLGGAKVESKENFELMWQNTYDQVIKSADAMKLSHEVVVCGNTNAICRKLDSLVKIGFQSKTFSSPFSSPKSNNKRLDVEEVEKNDNLIRENIIRPRSSGQDILSSREAQGNVSNSNRRTLSAGRKSNADDNAPAEPQIFLDSKKDDNQKSLKDKQFKNPYDLNDLKKKKKKKTEDVPTFKRNSLDQPPSLDLIAKFAIEKERQQKKFKMKKKEPKVQQDDVYDDDENDYDDTDNYDGNYNYNDGRNSNRNSNIPTAKGSKVSKKIKNRKPTGYHDDSMYRGEISYNYDNPNFGNMIDGMDNMSMMGGHLGGLSQQSILSASESDFMVRAAAQGDMSLLGDAESVLSNTSMMSLEKVGNQVHEALKERVAFLEKQVQAMSATAERREIELEKVEDKLRRTGKELETTRANAAREIQLLKESFEKDYIRLRDQHAIEMANLAASHVEPPKSPSIHKSSDRKDKNADKHETKKNDLGFGANQKLFEQLNNVQLELRKQQEAFSDERRNLQVEASMKLMALERQSKAEISALRSTLTILEDRILQKDEEITLLRSKEENLAMMNRQLEVGRKEAVDAQSKLRADLKNMQQSVAASYRLETAQGVATGGGVDSGTATRISEATSEAKVRQLTNKVEFLKSQLGAEQKAMEETKIAMATSRQQLEELRDEFRFRLQEAEQLKRQAVLEAEQRVESSYEERMSELTTLQTKLMMVQGQLQEAYQDSTIIRQKEEAARNSAAKFQSQQAVLKAEIEQLRTTIQEMREERDKQMAKDVNKHSNEATIRRLDNERQYLKSQLASEITHKNELQTALTQAQTQLSECQRQWKSDVDTLKEISTRDTQDAIMMEQQLQQKNVTLNGEVKRLTDQNKDLKEAFTKMRDQVRVEQLAVENAHNINQHLQDDIKSLKEEIVRSKQTEQEINKLNDEKEKVLKATLNELEERKTKEVGRLMQQIESQYKEYSASQREGLELRKLFEDERGRVMQRFGCAKILENVSKLRRARLATYFRTWNTNNTLIGVAIQFRSQVNDLMKETLDEANVAKEKALDALRTTLNKENSLKLDDMQARCDNLILIARKESEQQKLDEIEQLQDDFEIRLQEVEAKWNSLLEEAQIDGEERVQHAISSKNLEILEVQRTCDMQIETKMMEVAKATEAAIMQKAEEVSYEWQKKVQELEASLNQRQQDAIQALEKNHRSDIETEKQMAQETLDIVQREMELKQKKALDIAHAKFIDDIEALKAHLAHEKEQALISEREAQAKAIATLRQQNNETFEGRMREVRKVWQEELENKLAEKDSDMKEALTAKMEAHAISMEAERIRGIKLEASKWKQAMKDAEKRFEVETTRAKAEGRAEKEKEAQDEKDHIEVKHKLALSKSLEERKKLLEDKEHSNAEAMSRFKIEMENIMAEEVKKAQKNTKEELDIEWTAKLKREIENALYDSSTAWETKLQKEKDRLEKFKKEVTSQQQVLAEERNNLQEQVNNNQDIMKKIETALRHEKMLMQQGYETEMELLKNRMDKEKARLEEESKRNHSDLMDNLSQKQKDELQYQLKVQRDELERQNEQAMSQLQEESGKLITKLEAALEELRQEKNKLKDDLEKTTSKLEDTEDSLYDLQQSIKKKDTQHSIATWKLLTGVNKMKAMYKEGMNEFDQQAAAANEKVKKQMQNQVNEMILNAMKLATTVHEAEAARKKIHTCLVSHKNDSLGETRMKIKLYEKELERLIMERDSLEEQRDNMEEEIEMMELQVRDIEDQIREHNRTSSMQNGRVNVAHARKKRRLDSELERILETIEQRRNTMGELDDRVADKSRQRDEKESEMIDLEKLLVSTLVEQQKLVLKLVEDARFVEEKAKLITHVARLPWPPPQEPSMADVKKLLDEETKRLEEDK